MKTYTVWVAVTAAAIGIPGAAASIPETRSTPSAVVQPEEDAKKYVHGNVTAKTDTELTVQDRTGETTAVRLVASTKYDNKGAKATLDDVKVGSTVFVYLKSDNGGKLEADRVSLTDTFKQGR